MPKKRVFQLAKELGLQSNALIAALAVLGIEGLTPASPIDEDTATAVTELIREQLAKVRGAREAQTVEETVPAGDAPSDTAPTAEKVVEEPAEEAPIEAAPGEELVGAVEAEKEAEPERVLPHRPSYFDQEMLQLERQLQRLAEEVKASREAEKAQEKKPSLRELVRRPNQPRPPTAVTVPPVVTVLGHVDHGKTTLLDAIRKTRVTAQEDGGITQHIGASEVEFHGRSIVFLDTPGHEAFTQLRARGAQVTDIAVLVVAADDGVMPQTVEAINHARAANVPIIVAINKIDLPEANPQRVMQQLAEHGLVPEQWGGDTVVVEVSALTGEGLDELLEMILLVADMMDLWAEPHGQLAGVVIESRLDSSRGPIATILIRNGTLRVGDVILCDTAYGRVRRLTDWLGNSLKEVPPGHAAEVIGLSEVPEPGSLVESVRDIKEARRIAEERAEQQQQEERERLARRRIEEVYAELAAQRTKVLRAIIKADVWGSAEALCDAIYRLAATTDELQVEILHMGVGDVSESDITLAVASDATILAFRVDVPAAVRQRAQDEHVTIRRYDIIYDALEDIRRELEGMLEPEIREELIGRAEVLRVFRAQTYGRVAGCRIIEGRLQRGCRIIVLRAGEQIYRGTLDSLRHFDRAVDTLEAPN
ncbi:MAG: translation initiation factor IF-2, partial [Armatimonadetes bacterium]|nr:translation initiation factor IF-2 [Armatimonadota bacterium]